MPRQQAIPLPVACPGVNHDAGGAELTSCVFLNPDCADKTDLCKPQHVDLELPKIARP